MEPGRVLVKVDCGPLPPGRLEGLQQRTLQLAPVLTRVGRPGPAGAPRAFSAVSRPPPGKDPRATLGPSALPVRPVLPGQIGPSPALSHFVAT